jgi:NO-binding membrane sensor protein with MHYT domain
MAAKYILAVLAVAFIIAGTRRLARDGGTRHPQSKTWLLIGAIFAGVSLWLFAQP